MNTRYIFDSYALLAFFQNADCFALACAARQSAAIVTGDPEFQKVAHLAEIIWI